MCVAGESPSCPQNKMSEATQSSYKRKELEITSLVLRTAAAAATTTTTSTTDKYFWNLQALSIVMGEKKESLVISYSLGYENRS